MVCSGPSVLHLHEIGCHAYVLISGNNPKIATRLMECMLISYVTNQGIGLQQTNTKPPCHKGNKRRMRPFDFPTGLRPDRLQEIHMVTLLFKPQSVGTSSTKHGKVVPQLDDQVIILLRKSVRLSREFISTLKNHMQVMTPSGNGAILSIILIG